MSTNSHFTFHTCPLLNELLATHQMTSPWSRPRTVQTQPSIFAAFTSQTAATKRKSAEGEEAPCRIEQDQATEDGTDACCAGTSPGDDSTIVDDDEPTPKKTKVDPNNLLLSAKKQKAKFDIFFKVGQTNEKLTKGETLQARLDFVEAAVKLDPDLQKKKRINEAKAKEEAAKTARDAKAKAKANEKRFHYEPWAKELGAELMKKFKCPHVCVKYVTDPLNMVQHNFSPRVSYNDFNNWAKRPWLKKQKQREINETGTRQNNPAFVHMQAETQTKVSTGIHLSLCC
jgi:hypothetical protein